MALVYVPSQMRALVGDASTVEVAGEDIRGDIAALERTYPETVGWVIDETGKIRHHVKVFVNGEEATLGDAVRERDEVRILPAISGGAGELELLIGTRKGLIVLRGERGADMEIAARAFEGQTVEYAIKDQRTSTYLASVTSHFGPKLFTSQDPTGTWTPSEGPTFPDSADNAVERIWTIEPGEEDGVLWAGVAPAALFRSEDAGATWSLNRGLWDVPGRADWQPGGGGLCLHSISPWPGDPARLAVGISAAGVWISEDGGGSWRWGVEGLIPRYVPEDARANTTAYCVHDLQRPAAEPTTLYMQFHGGVYRSDDAGYTWADIGSERGLVSDFGFPLVVDPHDSKRAFVIPLASDGDRITPEGKVRVFETTDGGESWRPSSAGLPQEDSYLVILRQAFCHDGRDPLGLYFGATSGEVFGSVDSGARWTTLASRLPPVLSVRPSSR
jgi:molybdopterin converting factor small subunit